ncbi:hypothetical protein DAI22_01g316050 [Oryza sativa Japonica Group]|nr:hypothetical protein DAI22_01g316050 [Oryza sativa Japonica Group]
MPPDLEEARSGRRPPPLPPHLPTMNTHRERETTTSPLLPRRTAAVPLCRRIWRRRGPARRPSCLRRATATSMPPLPLPPQRERGGRSGERVGGEVVCSPEGNGRPARRGGWIGREVAGRPAERGGGGGGKWGEGAEGWRAGREWGGGGDWMDLDRSLSTRVGPANSTDSARLLGFYH